MLHLFLLIVITVLFINALYLFIFSLAGTLEKQKSMQMCSPKSSYLILIPAYKEDFVILESVQSLLKINYPAHLFKIVVLADSFEKETLAQLRKLHVEVVEIPEDKQRNKSKSIRYYLDNYANEMDVCLLLDAVNCVDPDILLQANAYAQNGVQILQAKRVAKNANNHMSRLDGLSEIINNHIFRKGQRGMGLSASLIGSGIFIDLPIFRKVMNQMNVFSGFDKEMEIRILREKLIIEYAEDILIYDEKVEDNEVFVNQRRRWTCAQFYFLKKYALEAFYQLVVHRNIDFSNKVFQFILLPRIITIGLSGLLLPFVFFLPTTFIVAILTLFALLFSSLFLAVRGNLKRQEAYKLIRQLTLTFIFILKAMLTSSSASKKFIHTPHKIKI